MVQYKSFQSYLRIEMEKVKQSTTRLFWKNTVECITFAQKARIYAITNIRSGTRKGI